MAKKEFLLGAFWILFIDKQIIKKKYLKIVNEERLEYIYIQIHVEAVIGNENNQVFLKLTLLQIQNYQANYIISSGQLITILFI